MEKKVRTLGSIHANSFSAHLDEVLLRTGEKGKRIRIDHPEAAAVIPFLSRDDILMVKQYRYALGRETLEIPAGKVDSGEAVDDCVKRELLEETGYAAGEVKRLYTYAPAIGYSTELIHIYSAVNLTKTKVSVDEKEISSIETVSIKALRDMIKGGRILDGKTVIALSILEMLG